MFKTLVICAVASASLAACSTTSPRPATTRTAEAACPLNSTASRIPARPGQCSASPGRTYSNEEVEQTGQTDLGSALQMLDPSISSHH
jgi:hypothetical protein